MSYFSFSSLSCRLVCLRPRICSSNFKKDRQPLRSFLLVFLIFPRAYLFNFAVLSHVLYEWLSQGHHFSYLLSEIWCYISLGGCIHKKTAFYAHLGSMQYCQSLVILIESILFRWVMYFSFVNVFFPSKFPHIRQRLSRFVTCGSRKDMQLLF